jgi:hypothetical protein
MSQSHLYIDKLVVDLYLNKEKSVVSCKTQVYLEHHGY